MLLLELAECDFASWLFPPIPAIDNVISNKSGSGGGEHVGGHPLSGEIAGPMNAPAKRMRSLCPLEILGIWTQLVHAVESMHRQGIIHFDIKPKNILVFNGKCPIGSPILLKLADFGLARQLQGSQSHISASGGWGTLKYMAPEVVHQPDEHFVFRSVGSVLVGGIGICCVHRTRSSAFAVLTVFHTSLRLTGFGVHLFVTVVPPCYLLFMVPFLRRSYNWSTISFRPQVADTWALGVILHQLLHGGSTPHEHLAGRGRVCLALGIADERAMKSSRAVGWISEAIPGPKGELLRDFFQSTQDACLVHDDRFRVIAPALKAQLHDLEAALNDLDPSGPAVPRPILLDHRPALKELLLPKERQTKIPVAGGGNVSDERKKVEGELRNGTAPTSSQGVNVDEESGDDRGAGTLRNRLSGCGIPIYLWWISLVCLGVGAVVCIVVFGILQLHRKGAPQIGIAPTQPDTTSPTAPSVTFLAPPVGKADPSDPTSEPTESGTPERPPSPSSPPPARPAPSSPAGDDRPTSSTSITPPGAVLAPSLQEPGPSGPALEQPVWGGASDPGPSSRSPLPIAIADGTPKMTLGSPRALVPDYTSITGSKPGDDKSRQDVGPSVQERPPGSRESGDPEPEPSLSLPPPSSIDIVVWLEQRLFAALVDLLPLQKTCTGCAQPLKVRFFSAENIIASIHTDKRK